MLSHIKQGIATWLIGVTPTQRDRTLALLSPAKARPRRRLTYHRMVLSLTDGFREEAPLQHHRARVVLLPQRAGQS